MTIDLSARIIPGQGAAGIEVGNSIFDLLETESPRKVEGRDNCTFYDFGAVKIWSRQRVIHQVGVCKNYLGPLPNGVRLGMSIAEVEEAFGSSVEEDDEDNLIVIGHPGWCFETEAWHGHNLKDNRQARMTEIFVFKAK